MWRRLCGPMIAAAGLHGSAQQIGPGKEDRIWGLPLLLNSSPSRTQSTHAPHHCIPVPLSPAPLLPCSTFPLFYSPVVAPPPTYLLWWVQEDPPMCARRLSPSPPCTVGVYFTTAVRQLVLAKPLFHQYSSSIGLLLLYRLA